MSGDDADWNKEMRRRHLTALLGKLSRYILIDLVLLFIGEKFHG